MVCSGSDRTIYSKSPGNLCQLTISKYHSRIMVFFSRDRITCREKFVILLKHFISYVLDTTVTCKEKLIAVSA